MVPFRVVYASGLGILVACLAMSPLPARPDPIELDKVGAASQQPPKSQDVSDGLERFKKQDFDGALASLKTAAAKDPDLPPPQVIMAQWFAQSNRPVDVRNFLELAVSKEPDDPEAYLVLSDIALAERRVTEASLLLAKARELLEGFTKSPSRKKALLPRALAGLASVAESRENWLEAQKHLEAWRTADPQNSVAMQRLARALFQQKKPEESLESLRAAAKADKGVLTPEATLARFYEAAGDQEQAKRWMAAALLAAPNDSATWRAAAQWALESGHYEQARDNAATAVKLEPASLEGRMTQGLIAMFLADFASAESFFQAAVNQSPASFEATNNLALALCEQNEPAKRQRALEYALVNVRQFPKQAEAYSTLGWAQYKLARLPEAEQALRTAASTGNITADTAYYLARVAVDRDRKDEARQLLQAALKSKTPFAYRKQAQALAEQLK